MIVYVENPREWTKNLLELMQLCKVVGYKVNVQKSSTVLYTSSEQEILENKNTI